MVGLGMLMLLLGVGGAWFRWRGQLYEQRLFLRFAVAMAPAGIIAMLAGWMTTEIGRQPWVVYGVMRTADAASHHSALVLSASLMTFVLVYCAVFGTGISYLLRVVATEPDRSPPPAGTERLEERPARPLSAGPKIDQLRAGE
jgi:cytochrome bd ubiquinol oxidase subunit I